MDRSLFGRVMIPAIMLKFLQYLIMLSVLGYDMLRSALKDRFGEAFIEVGFTYEGYRDKHLWSEWRVIFKETTLTEEDIEYIRSHFPRKYTVEVWTGIKTYTIMIMKPPIIEIETKTNSTTSR